MNAVPGGSGERVRAVPGPPPARFAALAVPGYRRFVAGQGVSLVGSWTETVAQAVLVLSVTHSGVMLGVVAALRYLPVLLLSPYAGLVVDRHDRRRVLVLVEALSGVLALTLGVVVLTGHEAPWVVPVFALGFGLLSAVENPARMAFVPELVPREALHSAVTLNSVLANVGRALGPLVAATLVGTVGVGWCFVADAASFGVVVLTLLSIDGRGLRREGTVARERGQVRAALRVVRATPDLVAPLAMMAVVGALTYEYEVSLPLLAEHGLRAGTHEYALLTAGFGVGAVLAGIVLVVRPLTGSGRLVVVSVAYAVALAALAASPTRQVADVVVVLVGACSIAFLTTGNSTVQLAAPPGMRGRVTSLWTTAFLGSTPVGALIVGAVGQWFGGRATVVVAACACLAAAALGSVLRRRTRA